MSKISATTKLISLLTNLLCQKTAVFYILEHISRILLLFLNMLSRNYAGCLQTQYDNIVTST